MSDNVLIFGATSGIAVALARAFAARGDRLVLAARDLEAVEPLAADLRVRFDVHVATLRFDALDFDGHAGVYADAKHRLDDRVDGVVFCAGMMPEERNARTDAETTRRTVEVNLTSAIHLLEIAAADLEAQGSGFIVGLSSVAGDRGRQSNYVYGCTKAGLSAYLDGLRHRLAPAGVRVLTVKPGFVFTAMTAGRLDPRSPLVAAPEQVARDVVRALERGRRVVYTPWYWGPILAAIRALPAPLFERTKL